MEGSRVGRRHFRRALLAAGRAAPLRRCGDRGTRPDPLVCARACSSVSRACLLHRRCHRLVRQPGGGHEIPGATGAESGGLWGGLGQRRHTGGVLVHGVAPVCGNLHDGCRARASDGIPLLWAGHQCACGDPHLERARRQTGRSPDYRRGALRRGHWIIDGIPFSALGTTARCGCDGHA